VEVEPWHRAPWRPLSMLKAWTKLVHLTCAYARVCAPFAVPAWTKLVHSASAFERYCALPPRPGCPKVSASVTFKRTGAIQRSCFPS
jgi:hypothetical protein